MRRPRERESGMATVELAACLPVLLLLLGAVLTAVAVVSARVHAEDAAGEAARAAARGDDDTAGRLARAAAPGGAVSIGRSGGDVVVRVRSVARPLGGLLPSFTVTGSATAALEPAGTLP